MKNKKIKLLLLKFAIVSTLMIINPIKIHAITPIPELTAYQKDNHVKLEWAVDIADTDILSSTSFENGQTIPNFVVDGVSAGGQSITTEDKYSGSQSVKVSNTYGVGNAYVYPATHGDGSRFDWPTRLYIPNGTNLSVAFKVKTSGTGTTVITPGMVGGWSNLIQPLPNKITTYAPYGSTTLKLDSVSGLYVGFYITTDTNPQSIQREIPISSIDTVNKTITLAFPIDRGISAGENLTFRDWRNPALFNYRTLTNTNGWTTLSINTKMENYSDYDNSIRGSAFYFNTLTNQNVYYDDVKFGYASIATVYKNGAQIYNRYLSDYEDTSATDTTAPNIVSNLITNNNNGVVTASWNSAVDNGTTYNYTIKGTSNSKIDSSLSSTHPVTITSGIKGYSVLIDTNPNGVPNGTITTTSTNYTVPTSYLKSGGGYVHVASVDNTGNMSSVNTYQYNDVTPPVLSLNTVLDGEIGHFEFENNQVINTVNGKNYIPTGTNTYPQGHINNGLQSNQGQSSIPLSDLGINDTTQTVSVSYWFKWNGENSIMPIGFNEYDAWIVNGTFGFNTGQSDVYGINNPYVVGQYVHTVLVFNKGDYTLNSMYINGVKQSLTQKATNQAPIYSIFKDNLNIGGWSLSDGFRWNGSSIDDVRIFNRTLTENEVSMLASDNNISDKKFSTKPLTLSVTAGDSTSGISKIKLPNNNYVSGSVASYVVSKNGTYTFVAYDNFGNETTKSITVSSFDDIPSTLDLDTALNGQIGDFQFENNQVINTINGKSYTGNGAYSYTQGHINNGLQENGGQIAIPLSDLGVNDTTQTISVSYWFKWNGEPNMMPIGFDHYDAWMTNGWFGYNTAQGDVYGINNPYTIGQYIHTVLVFNKGDYTLNSMYINGVKQSLTQKQSTQAKSYTTFPNYLNIGGWLADGGYRWNGSSIDGLKVFNRALTDDEIAMLSSDKNIANKKVRTEPITLLATTGDYQLGINKIKLPDNSYVSNSVASYTVSKNGTYNFVIYDNAGNETNKNITVSCYDETSPTLTVNPNTTNWISTLNAQKHALRLSTYAYNLKESPITGATYLDGNIQQTLSRGLSLIAYDNNFNIIKKVTYDTLGDATLCDNLANDINSLPNGSLIAIQSYDAYNINDNLRNAFKNIGIPNATTMNTDADEGIGYRNQRITLQYVTYKGDTMPLLFNYDRNGYTNADNTILVGNTGMYETISSTDTESKPNTIILPNGSRLYNNSLSLTNVTIKYLIFDNGTYNFKTTDTSGNTAIKDVVVTNIDNVLPTLNLTQDVTDYTTGNTVITATATDGESGVLQIQTPDGKWTNGSTVNYTATVNGDYQFSVKDVVGNISIKKITISNIDKEAPTLTLTQNPAWTNGSTTINVKAIDTVSGVKQIILPDGNIVPGDTATYTVNDIGVYYFKAVDNVGNIGINYIVVSNIDKNKPSVIITNNKNWSNANSENVTITATDK